NVARRFVLTGRSQARARRGRYRRGMAEPVVQIEGVSRAFANVVALDRFDLEVPKGTVTALLGPNGAGKTTTVRVITGGLKVSGGSVRVFGMDPYVQGEAVRLRCGVVSAKPALYDRLNGFDNLRYAAELFGLGADAPIEEAAARFGIRDALQFRVGTYSTGMKTRLALARDLAGVVSYERNGQATVQLDSLDRVPDLISFLTGHGVRLVRVEPHIPTLEDLYFAVRNKTRPGVFVRSHTSKSTKDDS